jgi:predicted SprT family Zn-dependent metalloprotease
VHNGTPTPDVVARLVQEQMLRHGLKGWSFKFNTNKRRAGVCKWTRVMGQDHPGSIQLSVHLLKFGWAKIEEVVIHEISHALAGYRAGHGPEWQRVARNLGIQGDRCINLPDGQVMVDGRYIYTCPNCNVTGHSHKKPRRRVIGCRRCLDRTGTFYPFVYTDTQPDRHERRATNRATRRKIRSVAFTVR